MDGHVVKAKLPKDGVKSTRRSGEAIIRSIEIACKNLSHRAMAVLTKAMDDETIDMRYRIEAAKEILNRGWGRAKQSVETTINVEGGEALIEALKAARTRSGLPAVAAIIESENTTQH